ncbi:hypothetical protein C8R42DRAFT_647958 [Lentinula raphanica]|nr:hypothetical protein C8R42DRAFT_647958 [Lentinula raphanica]
MSTIHNLPVEILEKIFRLHFCAISNHGHYVQRPSYPNPYQKSDPLTHVHASATDFSPPYVCQLWRSVCDTSSYFLPTLSLRYEYAAEDIGSLSPLSDDSRLCTFLKLTAPCPISIKFGITSRDVDAEQHCESLFTDADNVDRVIKASGLQYLLENHHRWTSATISVPYPIIARFFTRHLLYQNLRKLDFQIFCLPAGNKAITASDALDAQTLVPGCIPHLHTLVLSGSHPIRNIIFDLWRGSSVQVITLFNISVDPRHILILKEFTNLHTINFDTCVAFDPALDAVPPVLLPKVKKVSCIRLFSARYGVKFTPISYLILPELRELHVLWTEGLEEELVLLFERSRFKLKQVTLIQVPSSIYRPPCTEQFIPLMVTLSKMGENNQELVELHLNHTDAKWDMDEFQRVMEMLTWEENLALPTDVKHGSLHFQTTQRDNIFPFLKQLTISGYTVPDHGALCTMLESRFHLAETHMGHGLKLLQLHCPKSALAPKTQIHLESIARKGLDVCYIPWTRFTYRNWTHWNYQDCETE